MKVTGSPNRSHCAYGLVAGLSPLRRIGAVFVAVVILFFAAGLAKAQNRDPQAVFDYAEQREETGVDTHFGPTVIDRIFDPFKCCDEKMEEVGGPQVIGLYAPIWQTGTQSGVSDLLSQSLIDTTVHLSDNLQVSMVVADADGYSFYPDFKSFGRRFVYIPGFVYTPEICGWGKGRYEVNFSHIERTERFGGAGPASSVWLFSFQQELSPQLAAFCRFGTGDGRRTAVQQSLATGIVLTQFLGYNNDRLGIGFMWQDPSDSTRPDDYGMEMFWRIQLTENIQLTPDVQLSFDPSRNPNRDIEAAFGLRVGIYF